MSSLRLWVKVVLFFSSYTPLFIILLFKNFSQTGFSLSIFSIILTIIILLPNIFILLYVKKRASADNPKNVTISYKEEMNSVYIGYLMTYVIPFLSFEYINIWDVASLLLLLSIICYIYINSNLLYINIMLNLLDYNLFKIKDVDENEYMLISRSKKLLLNHTIQITSISDSFVVETRSENL